MVVRVLQENLLRALTRTGRILSTKPQLPIVQNVLLQTEGGRLRVVATNLETTESVWIGGKIEQEGSACVPARLLAELAMTLPPQPVLLSAQGQELVVQSGGIRASIPGVSPKEFPPVSRLDKHAGNAIGKNTLVSSVSLVLFAAATDDGRPVLTGVRFHTEGGETTVVATDGYRLSRKTIDAPSKTPLEMIAPARALGEFVKISQEEKEVEEVFVTKTGDGQLGFAVGDTELATRLIDGEYPNVDKIVPSGFTMRALLGKEEVARAVKSAAIFSRDNANIVRLIFENQTLTVVGESAQAGKNEVQLSAKIDGDGGEIAFNSRFLLDFLANFSEEEFLFEMTGSLNPGVFKPVKDDSFLHIIMPVRTSSG